MFKVQAQSVNDLAYAITRLVAENLEIFDSKNQAIDILDLPNVVYRKEPFGQNEFLNVKDIIARGYGDCEDLAAALVAYFMYIGYEARPALKKVGYRAYHVLVDVNYDGKWERLDPSKIKGMR
jgi:transglutaminase-like putative cysteine protease